MEDDKKDFINYDSPNLPSEEKLVSTPSKLSFSGVSSVVITGAIVVFVFLIGIVIWTFNVVFNSRTTQPLLKPSEINISTPSSTIKP